MSWISVGVGGATALMSAMNAKKQAEGQQRAQSANMLANAEQMRYSPWSGMKASFMPGQAIDPNAAALGAGMQGGLQGAMFGSQFMKNKVTPTPDMTPSVDASPTQYSYNGPQYFQKGPQQGGLFKEDQFINPNFFSRR